MKLADFLIEAKHIQDLDFWSKLQYTVDNSFFFWLKSCSRYSDINTTNESYTMRTPTTCKNQNIINRIEMMEWHFVGSKELKNYFKIKIKLSRISTCRNQPTTKAYLQTTIAEPFYALQPTICVGR